MAHPEDRIQDELRGLPVPLYRHVTRVRREARRLACVHGLDLSLVDLAASAHDLARHLTGQELLDRAQAFRIPVLTVHKSLPVLLHGPVAARFLEEWQEEDPSILEAVWAHTTATPGMSQLAKVIFLADKLDPAKASRYPFIVEVRRLANESLDLALLEFLNHYLSTVLENGGIVHPASLEARNSLMVDPGDKF